MNATWCVLLLFAAQTGDDSDLQAHLKKLAAGDDRAADALVKMGARAVPGLVELTRQASPADTGFGWVAAAALARIGEPAMPALRAEARKGNLFALSALKQMGPLVARGSLPELLAYLKNGPPGDPNGRPAYLLAIDLVGAAGPDARDAVPILLKQLSAQSPTAAHVIVALGNIGPAARDAVPALT